MGPATEIMVKERIGKCMQAAEHERTIRLVQEASEAERPSRAHPWLWLRRLALRLGGAAA
jgi:hypothetical protein